MKLAKQAQAAQQSGSSSSKPSTTAATTEEEFPRGGYIEHDAQRIADEMAAAEAKAEEKQSSSKGGKSRTAEKRKRFEDAKAAKKASKAESKPAKESAGGVELLKFKVPAVEWWLFRYGSERDGTMWPFLLVQLSCFRFSG